MSRITLFALLREFADFLLEILDLRLPGSNFGFAGGQLSGERWESLAQQGDLGFLGLDRLIQSIQGETTILSLGRKLVLEFRVSYLLFLGFDI